MENSLDKSKIAILTTVANYKLYEKTSRCFPEGIKKYNIDGTHGMYGLKSIIYMMKKMKAKNIDWLIMADEDVLFIKPNLVFDLIEEMESKSITISGVRDGGEISHRNQNPFVINSFFSVLNLKQVLSLWDEKEMLKHQYIENEEFDDDVECLKYNYDINSLFEPYYCFYLWLRRKKQDILFLTSKMHLDSITNTVQYKKQDMLYHTWYARKYGESVEQTKRIDAILKLNNKTSYKTKNKSIRFKSYGFIFNKKINKIKNKLKSLV